MAIFPYESGERKSCVRRRHESFVSVSGAKTAPTSNFSPIYGANLVSCWSIAILFDELRSELRARDVLSSKDNQSSWKSLEMEERIKDWNENSEGRGGV